MYRTIAIVLFLVTVNCKSSQNEKNSGKEPVRLIKRGNLFGSGEEGIKAQHLIITNQSDWNDLMHKMNAVNEVTSLFSETEIDFSHYSIIAVFDEVRGSGGHSLDLSIKENTKKLVVTVIRKAPKGLATSVLTQPYCIIKVPKSEKVIVFE